MNQDDIKRKIMQATEEMIAHEIKTQVERKSQTAPLISDEYKDSKTSPESFPVNDKTRKIIQLFDFWFKEEYLNKLNLKRIQLVSGKWYLPWDSGLFIADIEPNLEIIDSKIIRPSYEDPVRQSLHELQSYLTHKFRRRKDDSIFSAPHKTLLAKLCHKIVECIEKLMNREQKRFYYKIYKQFLTAIWEDIELINTDLRSDEAGLHLEDFIYSQMQICEKCDCYLSHEDSSSTLITWVDSLEKELAAIHICGAQTFHFLLQNKPIPKNLEKYLRNLSDTYHRLLMSKEEKKHSETVLKLPIKNLKHWKTISETANRKLQHAKQLPPYDLLNLKPLIETGVLSLEEVLFISVGENYTADQSLYLALYQPEYLSITLSERIDLFGSTEFLSLYCTPQDPLAGFQWLNWHIQQASQHHLPALEILLQCEKEDHESFHLQIKNLVTQIHQLKQAAIFCPKLMYIGALPELSHAVSYQTTLLSQFSEHLSHLQQHLHCLILIRVLLAQYKQILPQTGELIGALTLQTDLTLLAQVTSEIIKEIQIEINILRPLQGMGFVSVLDPSETIVVTKQTSLLDLINGIRKLPIGLITWRSQKTARERSLHDLEIRLALTHEQTTKIHSRISPKRVQHLAQKTKRQFYLARLMLTEGLKDHLSERQRSGLKDGESIITKWFSIVEESVSEEKKLITPPREKTQVTMDSIRDKEKKQLYPSEKKSEDAKHKEPEAKLSTIEDKKENPNINLMNYFTDLMNKIFSYIQSNPKDAIHQWENYILIEQENFFSEFSKVRNKNKESEWIQFFKDELGVLYVPLPPLEKPTRFLWWYRHTLQDRQLFFNLIALNQLSNLIKQNPIPLTQTIHHELKKLLLIQHEKLREKSESAWSLFEPFHCYLKSKWSSAALRLKKLHTEINSIRIEVQQIEIREKKSTLIESKAYEIDFKHESKLISESLDITQERSKESVSDQSKKSRDVDAPLTLLSREFKPGSQKWICYDKQLRSETDLNKQRIIVMFFSQALLAIEQRKISIETNKDVSERFKAITTLFMEIIKTTSFVDSMLSVTINALNKSFHENTLIVQQIFFIKQSNRILKHYDSLLSAQDQSLPSINFS